MKAKIFVPLFLLLLTGQVVYALEQRLEPINSSVTTLPGHPFQVALRYTTSPPDPTTTGLGVRLFWNSRYLTFLGFDGMLGRGSLGNLSIEPDVGNLDGDGATDTRVTVAWGDPSGTWPGSADADLLFAQFRAEAGLATTTLRFATTGTAGNGTFRSTPVTVRRGTDTCVADTDTLCLSGRRFRIEATWRDFSGKIGRGRVVATGASDSGLLYFFDSSNWEVLIKVLDGCAINQKFWVFGASTTNVEYRLRITDVQSGKSASYLNPLGQSASAITDTEALPICAGSSVVGEAEREVVELPQIEVASLRAPLAESEIPEVGSEELTTRAACTASAEALCLASSRYKVEVTWKDFSNQQGRGRVAPPNSANSGIFYFFSANNWEMLVKVLDGCAVNNKVWVFAAASTNVEYLLKVTDTQTGRTKEYRNTLGQASPAITDIEAFAGCS